MDKEDRVFYNWGDNNDDETRKSAATRSFPFQNHSKSDAATPAKIPVCTPEILLLIFLPMKGPTKNESRE